MANTDQRNTTKIFIDAWKNKGDEKSETQRFWIGLLRNVLGIENAENYICFEKRVQLDHVSFIDAYIPEIKVLIEQKSFDINLRKPQKQSDGTELTPFQQAKRYADNLPNSERPRYIVVCNFASFLIYDMEHPRNEPEEVLLVNLSKELHRLSFLISQTNIHLKREMELSIKAGKIIGVLYDEILKHYKDPTAEHTLKSLNMLCVRLVFCLYAEDAGIFGRKNQFHDYLKRFDACDLRRALIDLFKVLDEKLEERDSYLNEDLAAFPYVNGGLFADESIEIPQFDDSIKELLLAKASDDFNWSDISPTIFGAVFESTLNPETRRSGGMHYTSIENIHKVIDPLFLNDLRNELNNIKELKAIGIRNKRLLEFQNKLASLTFLDPACGSGNFLTETYLSLRRIENEILKTINAGQGVMDLGDVIKVSIGQFYGIEINDFAVTVAKTALWIAESQMMKATEDIVHMDLNFLPLKSYANIVEGNALRIDWLGDGTSPSRDKFPKYDYIMGNPPFIGYSLQSKEQKEDILSIYVDEKGKPYKTAGKIDYVAGWFFKAAQLMAGSKMRCALVSTNSITQGEQVAAIWKPLFERFNIRINFAHRTFRWDSEASIKAHVHCVIVGFMGDGTSSSRGSAIESKTRDEDVPSPIIYTNGRTETAKNINAYLLDADNIFIESNKSALCKSPEMLKGSQPTDGGNFFFTVDEKNHLLNEYPFVKKYLRPFLNAEEFINKKERWCLWLVDANPSDLKKCPIIMNRIAAVRQMRLESSKVATQKWADKPTLFTENRQPLENYLIVPRVSSENRRYVPIGYIEKDVICGDSNLLVINASLYHFGVLTSSVHMAWMRAVCGRLKSDYRYSKDIVYNNFPWPMGDGTSSSRENAIKFKTRDEDVPSPNPNVYFNPLSDVSRTSGGNLPHWHQDGKLQFVTFRLADSLPQEKLDELKARKEAFYNLHPQPWDDETAEEYFNTIGKLADEWLDAGHGSCVLAFPMIRKIVEDALLHFDGERYRIHSFVIMPNHVHILVELLGEYDLSGILHSWKGFTSKKINQVLGETGTFWQGESWDRMVRSEKHYRACLEYIRGNMGDEKNSSRATYYILGDGTSSSRVLNSESFSRDEDVPSPIAQTAQGILDARALYPDCSLADLYDETTMPPELRKAHQANDRAVMEAYGFASTMPEPEIVAELMKCYQVLSQGDRN